MLSSIVSALVLASSVLAQVTYQNYSQTIVRVDNGTYGPEIEEVHYCVSHPIYHAWF